MDLLCGARQVHGGLPGRVAPTHNHDLRIGYLEHGALASPVGTEQRQDFTALDVQVHILQRLVAAGIGLCQVRYGNYGLH